MNASTIKPFATTRAARAAVLVFAVALTASVSHATSPPEDTVLADASKQYCDLYTKELTHFMLTQGTPYDVAIMEANIGGLEDGSWTIASETLGLKADSAPNAWVVDVRCTWSSPVPDLNAPFEVQYRLKTDPVTGAILDVAKL